MAGKPVLFGDIDVIPDQILQRLVERLAGVADAQVENAVFSIVFILEQLHGGRVRDRVLFSSGVLDLDDLVQGGGGGRRVLVLENRRDVLSHPSQPSRIRDNLSSLKGFAGV